MEDVETKLLFLDLDGTLLSSALNISKRNLRALRRTFERGVHVVLASGRPAESVLAFAEFIGCVSYVIVSNGAAIIECSTRRVIAWSELSTTAASRIPSIGAINKVSVCMYSPLQWFVCGINNHIELEIMRSRTNPIIVNDFKDITSPKIKAMFIGEQPNLQSCEVMLSQDSGLGIKWFYTYPEYIDLIPHQVSKGIACLQICELLQVAREQVMAIGDGVNDLEMLQEAHIKVAVANASPVVLSQVNYVAPINDQDGVAVAVEALLLNDGKARSRLMRVSA